MSEVLHVQVYKCKHPKWEKQDFLSAVWQEQMDTGMV